MDVRYALRVNTFPFSFPLLPFVFAPSQTLSPRSASPSPSSHMPPVRPLSPTSRPSHHFPPARLPESARTNNPQSRSETVARVFLPFPPLSPHRSDQTPRLIPA